MTRLVAVIALLLALGGCASTMPLTPENESGSLVVYQPMSSHSGVTEPFLYVDEHRIGRLGIGAVESIRLAAGSHRVAIREALLFWPGQESAVAHVDIGVGSKTWLRFSREQTGVSVDSNGTHPQTRPLLEEVGAVQGEALQ